MARGAGIVKKTRNPKYEIRNEIIGSNELTLELPSFEAFRHSCIRASFGFRNSCLVLRAPQIHLPPTE
jgi:hypothetical protein